MRSILLAIVIAVPAVSSALAETPGVLKLDKHTSSDRLLPLKRPGTGNSCAAFGPGFVKADGTDTCVKIGGAVRIDAGVSGGSR
jgi:hypothetical protein